MIVQLYLVYYVTQGNSLTIPEKEMVVHVKHYFDKEQELYSKTKEFPSVINPAVEQLSH